MWTLVPIYLNTHFRDNPLAVADAKQLLAAHGISETADARQTC